MVNLNETIGRFAKFAGVGVIGTVSHYAIFLALVHLIAANIVVASSCGYIFGGIVNYLLNYRLTFDSSQPHLQTAPRFFFIAVVGFFINAGLMLFFVGYLTIHYLVSQIAATLIILIWNFLGNEFWTFQRD